MNPQSPSDARLDLVERFFDGTGPTYDAMVFWATLGIDRLWKRRMLARIPPGDGPVLDLACGTGISTLSIARRFPQRRVIGVELREEYLQVARAKLARERIGNVELVLCRAEEYDSPHAFDCVTSSYLAKYADLPLLTRRSARMLRPGGLLMMHDFTLPPQPLLRAIWRLYFVLMRNTVARALPQWREIYVGLPALIERTRWLSELPRELERNGFRRIRREYQTLYGSAIVTAIR
ncbi:MAG TPA: class I SAM-dependent methyltransferase [Burkholderiaceae bacterium]|nr:class I SAM-dependent methyltransferase [Burkholderiaceae bacterium]